MILKQIIIENYLCYYDVKRFDLAAGLNIILGENGEGKTKFFEALDWLFKGDNKDLDLLVSAKALADAHIKDIFKVRVAVVAEQHGETKTLTKSFLVEKLAENKCSVSNFVLEGIEENSSGERSQVDGKQLLEYLFPTEIRRYSMFKGESELNIFENEEALVNLINSFSDAKHYGKYAEKGEFLRKMAEKAVDDATRADSKNQNLYKKLQFEIEQLEDQKNRIKVHENHTQDQIRKTEANLQEVENHIKNAEALEVVNKRIKQLEDKVSATTIQIDENYTTSLFDNNWILVNFEQIHKAFIDKVMQLGIKKRELQSQFDIDLGEQEGKRKAVQALLNNTIPLPIGVPSRAHMEEMLKDEVCKVCNRPAKKGSPPYEFMVARLAEYLETQVPQPAENRDQERLYKNDYVTRLLNLATTHDESVIKIRNLKSDIKDFFEFNDARRRELEELTLKLQGELKERELIIGNSTGGSDSLTHVLKNYNSWQRDLKQHYKESNDHERELKQVVDELDRKKEEKESIDTKTANQFLLNTRIVLRDIDIIFKETKARKFEEFIDLLEQKANSYFWEVNKGSFIGSIKFYKPTKGLKETITIELQEEGRPLYKPNQSLLTSMHISILFAISELAKEQREESYPLIFDAPTSSFGDIKTEQFLNILSSTENQIILLLKNFIAKDEKSENLMIKQEFSKVKRDKAFWVKLVRPFDPLVLKTINTEVITL